MSTDTTRMTPHTSPLIIGFGHKAKQGKDTAASMLLSLYGTAYDIRTYAFGDALRQEVNEAMAAKLTFPLAATSGSSRYNHSIQSAMYELCREAGVEYDPNPVVDALYPYGKQRKLLQWWGTEYRRNADPFYWVRKLEQRLAADRPQIALIPDLRFYTEAHWIKYLGGYTVKVERLGFVGLTPEQAAHPSENELNNYEFDYHVKVAEGDLVYLCDTVDGIFNTIIEEQSPLDLSDVNNVLTHE